MALSPTEWCSEYAAAWNELVNGEHDIHDTLDYCYTWCGQYLHEDPVIVAKRNFSALHR